MKKVFTDTDLKVFLITLLVVTFAIRSIIFLDPDFGWRLRTGFEIIKNGVPKTDIYSYTMPSFPWVDHAWMTDVLISAVYAFSGKIGLGIVFSLITTGALLISVSGYKTPSNWLNFWWRFKLRQQNIWYFTSFIFVLGIASLITFSGVRAQVITWFFFALFIKLIFSEKLWKRFKFFVPLIFFVWANFHGGFVSGLGVFWVIMLVRTFYKKAEKQDYGILLISTLLTFVNPYGWGVYREVWSSVSDNSLRFEILEWQPAFLSFDVPSLIFVAFSAIFVTIYRKKFLPEQLVIYCLVLFEGISSIRHFPLYILIAIPMTMYAINMFYDSVRKKQASTKRFVNLYSYFWLFCFLVSFVQVALSYKGAIYLSEENFYPRAEIEYLKQSKLDGNVFSDYAWGGYLIWQLPEKKVFIDGRMPSWKWQKDIPGESNNAMKDYIGIIKGKKDYKELFEKYNIKWALVPVQKPEGLVGALEKVFSNKFNSIYKFFGIDEAGFSLSQKLEDDGWNKVYEDKISMIFVKTP